MSLTVDQLLAESSSDEDQVEANLGEGREVAQSKDTSRLQPSAGPTLEEVLAQVDLSDDEDEDDIAGAAAKLRVPEARSKPTPSSGHSGNENAEESQERAEGKPGQKVGLDELLAMGSDSSSDEKVDPATSEKAQEKTHGDRMRAAMPPASERGQSCEDATQVFLESPFEWCLEHERSLLQSSNGDLPDERDSGNCNGKATAAGASSLAEALQAARIPRLVEVKPCSELRRLLAQEVGLPTCVAASNKLVGVGTLRGAVVLLDNKLQDVPKDNKPQVLSPGEEASAVTSAAFSIDGGSLLVGHKSGQLALWDLASQKVACVVQDVHSSPVLSLAFCRPSWQYALSADAKGSVYFISFFTGTFGRLDFEKQLLLEQSSSIGVTLRVLPLQVSSQQNHPADTHCLVALCASSATVLLTLHPSASVVQKIQYNAKDASWVPDATWLRMESQDWTQSPQAEVVDPQLCVAYGQTIHIMRVSYGMNEVKGKEEFKVSLLGRYSWGFPIRGLVSFNDSVWLACL